MEFVQLDQSVSRLRIIVFIDIMYFVQLFLRPIRSTDCIKLNKKEGTKDFNLILFKCRAFKLHSRSQDAGVPTYVYLT